jgi:Zn-dependent protease with chaperone function
MITGLPGFLLNSLSIIVMSAVIIMALISLALYLHRMPLHRLTAKSRQSALWILIGSPWLIGVLAAVIVMVSSAPVAAKFTSNQWVHWHHPAEFSMNSWHGYFVFSMLSLALFMFLRAGMRAVKSIYAIRTLLALSSDGPDGVRILDTNAATAFTAGIRKPDCFMTSALLNQITDDEYKIIHLHETAHIQHKDPVKKTLFHLLTTFFPARLALAFNQSMTTAMEQCADAVVVSKLHDTAAIARTLLKVRRLAVRELTDHLCIPQVCHYGLDNIDQRIRYLLADQKGHDISVMLTLTVISLLAIACALGADSIHHAIELSLNHS